MSLAQENNTPTRPRIEPGSPDPESDALTTRPVRPLMEMYIQNLVKFCPSVLKILSGNEILTSIKGHNSVANLRNLPLYNPYLDIINVNVYTKFG